MCFPPTIQTVAIPEFSNNDNNNNEEGEINDVLLNVDFEKQIESGVFLTCSQQNDDFLLFSHVTNG